MIKSALLAIAATLLLTSCAGVAVKKTYVATGAANPRTIYIRPFDVSYTNFNGRHRGGVGERPIRQSLAGLTFAETLKEEVEKISPALVLKPGDKPTTGWLIEGELDIVHAGSPFLRAVAGPLGIGRSEVQIHVRIVDLDAVGGLTGGGKDKGAADSVSTSAGSDGVIYAFTLQGGSRASGARGTITAPGLGYAVPFDFRNAAERVYLALSRDPFRYGVRSSPTYRY